QAKEKADAIIDDLMPADQLAIVLFDNQPRTLLSYEQAAELTPEQLKKTARSVLADTAPTWHATQLGRAISYAADIAVTYEADDSVQRDATEKETIGKPTGPAKLVLISDMQQGSHLESLQAYSWPKELTLDIRRVVAAGKTNASAQILSIGDTFGSTDRIRVRVANVDGSESSRFRLSWVGDSNQGFEMPVQVPRGETRVIRMPLPHRDVTSLMLQDDDHSFDNLRYLVSPQPQSLTLLYLGSDDTRAPTRTDVTNANTNATPSAADRARDSLLYYLNRVPLNNSRREVTVTAMPPDKLMAVPDSQTTPLVVVGQSVSTDIAERLKQYAAAGGKLLFVMSERSDLQMQPAIESISGANNVQFTEAKVDDYVMFSQIDFAHPLFEPMSDPQFNDFTKVRFWSHRKLASLPNDWNTIVKFDDGDPAIVEKIIGEGRMWVMTTGWQPSASQLALSTKFLPLIYSFFETLGGDADQYGSITLGEPIGYPPSPSATITGPGETTFEYTSQADLDLITQPGIYQYSDHSTTHPFAVNLAESESHTVPMADDVMDRFGIKMGKTLTVAQSQMNQRQLRDIELEKQQKVWQWLLAAALVLLAIETLWGGLISRSKPQTATS
ncbi:MAG: hypothetical protein HKN47_09970, partial [Pirellulaceae bacterium]|nr:hypothetical protein [Pirellulaceae bacterium]